MAKRSKRSKRSKNSGSRRKSGSTTTDRETGEWVGGMFELPVTVAGQAAPNVLIWLAVESGLIVGQALVDPGDPEINLGNLLARTIEEPLVGLPRRPRRVRVANDAMAQSVAAAVANLDITVASTPELQRVMRELSESFTAGVPADHDSYVELGYLSLPGVRPDLVAALFDASAALWRAAPWQVALDSDVLRVDVPSLGIEAACLSIIGAAGQDFGLVLFPSAQGFLEFIDRAEHYTPGAPGGLGTSYLSLNFERGADLPKKMRREIARHHFTVAAPAAHPVVMSVTENGNLLSPPPQDLMLLTACARATTEFFDTHARLFEDDYAAPANLEVVTPEGVKIHLYGPVPPELFDAPAMAVPDHPLLAADWTLAAKIMEFADRHHGGAWWDAIVEVEAALGPPEFGLPILIYHVLRDGQTLADQFAASGPELDAVERTVLEAQRSAWLSVWEVTDVDPGNGFTATDTLSGKSRSICDGIASQSVIPGAHILARVVTVGDESVLVGVHPSMLSPGAAQEIVERARKRLRRKRAVPPARLRDPRFCYALAEYWEDALEFTNMLPEQISNMDGDPLLVTIDHFELRGDSDAALARLAALEGIDAPEPGTTDDDAIWHFTGAPSVANSPMENVLLGHAYFRGGRLLVESNSINRADTLRGRIEDALGADLAHVAREHTDPFSAALPDELGAEAERDAHPELPPEQLDILTTFKQDFYADWADQPLPALDGQTARAAVKTRAGRDRVDALLKDMEYTEQQLPAAERADFSSLRRALGLS